MPPPRISSPCHASRQQPFDSGDGGNGGGGHASKPKNKRPDVAGHFFF